MPAHKLQFSFDMHRKSNVLSFLTSIDRLKSCYRNAIQIHTPIHASWLNQIKIYFSVLQRKVLTPNYFESLEELEDRILGFQEEYKKIAKPFKWKFTRDDSKNASSLQMQIIYGTTTGIPDGFFFLSVSCKIQLLVLEQNRHRCANHIFHSHLLMCFLRPDFLFPCGKVYSPLPLNTIQYLLGFLDMKVVRKPFKKIDLKMRRILYGNCHCINLRNGKTDAWARSPSTGKNQSSCIHKPQLPGDFRALWP